MFCPSSESEMCLDTSVEDHSVRVILSSAPLQLPLLNCPQQPLKEGQRRFGVVNLVRLRDLTQMFEGIEVRDEGQWHESDGAFPQKLGLGDSGMPDIIGSERLWAEWSRPVDQES